MKIAVTGNTGFIGSALMNHLSRRKDITVYPFDKKSYSLSFTNSLKEFVRDKDAVIHLAGVTSPPEKCYAVNTLGTQHLLETIRLYGKSNSQFIFASTFAVYEEKTLRKKLDEDGSKTIPRNHYGMSKLLAEELVKFYNRKNNMNIRILRISNPYGPTKNKKGNGVISLLIDKIKTGQQIVIDGDGTQSRDFIFIQDVINAFEDTLNYQGSSLLVNICSGQEVKIINLVRKIESIFGKKANISFNKNYNDKGYWIGNPTKAAKKLGFSAGTTLDYGLQQTINRHQSKD